MIYNQPNIAQAKNKHNPSPAFAVESGHFLHKFTKPHVTAQTLICNGE
jgi:hypothetical protein